MTHEPKVKQLEEEKAYWHSQAVSAREAFELVQKTLRDMDGKVTAAKSMVESANERFSLLTQLGKLIKEREYYPAWDLGGVNADGLREMIEQASRALPRADLRANLAEETRACGELERQRNLAAAELEDAQKARAAQDKKYQGLREEIKGLTNGIAGNPLIAKVRELLGIENEPSRKTTDKKRSSRG